MRRVFRLFPASCLAAAVLVGGCAVGPDFTTPSAPDVAAYDAQPAPEKTADEAQKLLMGQDIPAAWWELFHCDSINRLVAQAIKNNPDLASAEASLRVAQDNLAAGSTALFPSVSGSFNAQREQVSGASFGGSVPGSTFTLYNASVAVSYGPDLWGGTRRAIERLQAEADAAGFEKEAAYLTLTSNVVTAAFQEASLRAQITAAREIIAEQEKVLRIFDLRLKTGAVAKSSVLAQRSTLAAAKAALPPLEHQLAVTRHALAALVGRTPANALPEKFDLAALTLPQQVPLSLPSKLAEQRPDIRAAEENLHAASAAIGVAEAARLPNITLSADIGSMANILNKLFSPGGGFWDLGAGASETLFDAGALADKESAARDAYDAAAAQYRKTVLAAFQNVADALHALQSDAESLNARMEAGKAAADTLALAQTQFKAGAIGAADLLLAEQAEQQAKAALASARATRYADTAALFTALGGGWWNRDAVTLATSDAPAPAKIEKETP
ncbi:MAG: efflux transporter outer membrane subunit [Alphaproteobacteria bacterium]|nr:efflux transporter outer membrane subunit [Alphaproteobacteria bacterium]